MSCEYWDEEIKTCRRSEVPRIAIPLDVNLDEAIRNEEFKVIRFADVPEPKIENRWIPVTERLPEKIGKYLCSLYYAVPPYHMFHPEKDTYIHEVSVETFDGKAFINAVKAWMPLPEPWKGDEE